MRQQLETKIELYLPRFSEQRQQVYFVAGDLERLSGIALYTGDSGISSPKFTQNTGYFPLTPDGQIGVTHHKEGLGKLKYNEGGVEYGVPLTDIINKPLNDWRIDKK